MYQISVYVKNESIVSKNSTIDASIITNAYGNTSLSYQNNTITSHKICSKQSQLIPIPQCIIHAVIMIIFNNNVSNINITNYNNYNSIQTNSNDLSNDYINETLHDLQTKTFNLFDMSIFHICLLIVFCCLLLNCDTMFVMIDCVVNCDTISVVLVICIHNT